MAKVISVHEYSLRPGVSGTQFREAVRIARERGLLQLPGLVEHHFLERIRGEGRQKYIAIWIYESKEAWERLWGPQASPYPKEAYPEKWIAWEREILAPLLDCDPDKIRFAAYETF